MTKARLVAFFGSLLIRAIIVTLRVRIEDHVGFLQREKQPPRIWLFWHNRLFMIPYLFERYMPKGSGSALTSASKDGDYLAAFIERFGVHTIRGSSSRRGVAALLEMKTRLADGIDVAITPDGPRGPRYHLNPGVILLAQKTGAPIMPINVEFSRAWRLGRWDGFFLPKPFAKAEITFGAYLHVAKTSTPEDFETERARIEHALSAMMVAV